MSNSRRIFKNTVFLFVRMVVVVLIGIYSSRVILRTLGFEDFGIYNVVGSVVTFFMFLKTALKNATQRYITFELGTGNVARLRQIYSMAINCHAILAVGLWVMLEVVGIWFVNHHLNIAPERMEAANWVFQFSLLTFVVNTIKVPFSANIIAHEKMNFYAIISIVDALLQLGIIYLLNVSPIDKLTTYGFLFFVETLIVTIGYVVYCWMMFKDCVYIRFWDRHIVSDFAKYSGWSLLVNAADGTGSQCRSIFFNWFFGALANAALGVANRVISLIDMFVNNFTQAYGPQITKSYAAGNRDYFMTLIYSTSKLTYFLFILVCVPIVLNIDFILHLWLGEYPDMTASFVKAIVIFYIFDSFQMPFVKAVHATGKLRVHQSMIASIKFAVIPLTYLALRMGQSAQFTLYLWAAFNAIAAVARTLYMKRLINLSYRKYMKEVILPMALVTVVSVPASWYVSTLLPSGWVRLLGVGGVFVVLMGGSSLLFGLTRQERKFAVGLIPFGRK